MASASLIREHEEREYLRREWHYAKCEGVSRRHRREKAREEHARKVRAGEIVEVRHSTADDVRKALAARTKADKALVKALRNLPEGDERKAALRACTAAGISQGDLSRMMALSRQRIHQLVALATRCPF